MAVTMITCGKKWASHLLGDAGRRIPIGGGPGFFTGGVPPASPAVLQSLPVFLFLASSSRPPSWHLILLLFSFSPPSLLLPGCPQLLFCQLHSSLTELPQTLLFLVSKMG